jgi:regulator of protease activity HflC (stomatin/prohibitin superfamily)
LLGTGLFYIVVLFVLALFILQNTVRVLREYERAVIFRLGKLAKAFLNPGGTGNGPGLVVLLPMIDRMVKVSLRTVTMDVPAQDIITKDNVSLKVSAVIYFRVLDAEKAVVQVEDYLFATSQIAQTTLRSVLGQSQMDELLMERDRINQRLQQIIDAHTEPWGVKVSVVEVKQIDLPPEMQRAMAKQAEAELQASEKLAEAGRIMAVEPVTVQLRYLQTLTEIGTEKNSTIIFPIPIDILKTFMQGDGKPAPNP